MSRRLPVLTVRESHILQLLRGGATPERVVKIGAYRRSWTPDHVNQVLELFAALDQPDHVPWTPTPFAGDARDVHLTQRQADVLDLLCAGASNPEIAEALHVGEQTVKTHVKGVIAALGAESRFHAALMVLTGRVRVVVPNPIRRSA